MLTDCSSSARAPALPASTALTIARSGGAESCAASARMNRSKLFLAGGWRRGQRVVAVVDRVRDQPVAAAVLLQQDDVLADVVHDGAPLHRHQRLLVGADVVSGVAGDLRLGGR